MIIKHYLELLSHYRRPIIILVASTTVAAAVLSFILLFTAPLYTATASVVMLPTEAELTFTRGWLGFSQYNPANVLSQTQMEYLLSRPVAEKTLSKIAEGIATKPQPSGAKALVGRAISKARRFIRKTYLLLNSGKFVPLGSYEDALQELMDSIEIEMIEGSYVLQIEVTLFHPEAAAAAANALADGYDEMIAEQSIQAAGRLSAFFDREIDAREAELDTLTINEYALMAELDVLSLADQRQYLLSALESERQALAAAQVELGELDARMAALREQGDVQQRRILAKLDEEMTMEGVTRTELEQRISMRRRNIAALRRDQEDLAEKEKPLTEIASRKESVEADLASLRERRLNVSLSTSSQLSQVRMINPATVPLYPSSPKVVFNTAVGFFAGVLFAFFALVVVDTTSGTVKTFTDLRRLVGARAIARLTAAMVAQATGRGPRGKKSHLAGVAGDLAGHMVLSDGGRVSNIEITAFDEKDAAEAAATVAAALVQSGQRVVCRLPKSVPLPDSIQGGDDKYRLLFVNSDEGVDRTGALSVVCLSDVSPWSRVAAADRGEAAVVCVVAAGALSEEDLQALDESALRADVSNVFYVLLAK